MTTQEFMIQVDLLVEADSRDRALRLASSSLERLPMREEKWGVTGWMLHLSSGEAAT